MMKANIKKIRHKRHFTEDFKRHLVKEYERGELGVLELEKLYHVSNKKGATAPFLFTRFYLQASGNLVFLGFLHAQTYTSLAIDFQHFHSNDIAF